MPKPSKKTTARREKAAELLPVLRQAALLKSILWRKEAEMERIIGSELSDEVFAYDGLVHNFEEDSELEAAKLITLKDAVQMLKAYEDEEF